MNEQLTEEDYKARSGEAKQEDIALNHCWAR